MSTEEQQSMEHLQLTEQALQNLVMQKQVFQLDGLETSNALEEIKKKKDDEVYKIIGSVMFKANKEDLVKELEKKSEMLNLRMKAIEKQEEQLKNQLLKVREQILKKAKVEKK